MPWEVIDLMSVKVDEGMNHNLTKEFTIKEVSDTLFQIELLKASGPDSFPARFFQINW